MLLHASIYDFDCVAKDNKQHKKIDLKNDE